MMTTRWSHSVARAVQELATRELGRAPDYQHCLRVVRKHANDPGRPKTIRAFAAYVFDKEYP